MPASSKRVIPVCLRSWKFKSSIPASAQAPLNAFLKSPVVKTNESDFRTEFIQAFSSTSNNKAFQMAEVRPFWCGWSTDILRNLKT